MAPLCCYVDTELASRCTVLAHCDCVVSLQERASLQMHVEVAVEGGRERCRGCWREARHAVRQLRTETEGNRPGDAFFIGVEAPQSAHGVLLASMLTNRAIDHALLPASPASAAGRLHQGVHITHTSPRRTPYRPSVASTAYASRAGRPHSLMFRAWPCHQCWHCHCDCCCWRTVVVRCCRFSGLTSSRALRPSTVLTLPRADWRSQDAVVARVAASRFDAFHCRLVEGSTASDT